MGLVCVFGDKRHSFFVVIISAFFIFIAGVPSHALAFTCTWTGTTSTDWATAGNWSGCNSTTPQSADDVVIDGGTIQPTLNLSGGGITINSLSLGATTASTLTISNAAPATALTVTGSATIAGHGTLTHAANSSSQVSSLYLSIEGDLTINSGGSINVNGKGYAGRSANSGYGPGGGKYGTPNGQIYSGAGGGYGGAGGGNSGAYGKSYGSVTQPTDLGSASGAGNPAGTSGGGAVKLVVSGTLTNSGSITANGNSGVNGGNQAGGGSGGSIWITASTLDGAGSITANGGVGYSYAGSGGGGRIAIYDTTDSYSGTLTAYGSGGRYPGGAGTIYKNVASATYGDLTLNNNGNIGTTTTALASDTFANLSITNGAFYLIPNTRTITVTGSTLDTTTNAELYTYSGGSFVADNVTDLTNLTIVDSGSVSMNALSSASGLSLTDGGTFTAPNLSTFTSGTLTINSGATFGVINSANITSSTVTNNGFFNNANSTLTVAAGTTWNENGTTAAIGDASHQITDLVVNGTLSFGNQTSATATTFTSLTINSGGSVSHYANSSAETYSLNLALDTLTINSGGSINVNGKGYAATQGPGAGSNGTSVSGGSNSGAGGGYGGAGAINTGGHGQPYGSETQPSDIGSGSGNGTNSSSSGSGGGAIKLSIAGMFVNNGSTVANGNNGINGLNYAGGGSGGSIWITAGTLDGAGSITANGGVGYSYAGSGGGGRIAMYVTSNTYDGTLTVLGGGGAHPGDAGTIYPSTSLSTASTTDIGGSTATLHGSLDSIDPSESITGYGFAWSSANNPPTTADSYVSLGATSTAGAFSSLVSSLTKNVTYYVRAFATSTSGTTYATTTDSFTTLASNAPNAPSTLGPSNLVDGGTLATSTPTFTFTQSDPDAGDTVAYTFELATSSSFASPVIEYTSDLLAQGAASFTVGQAEGSGTYATGSEGQTLLSGSYYWRVKPTDNSNFSGPWSAANSGAIAFMENQTPSVTISAPTDGASETTSYAAITGTASDPDGTPSAVDLSIEDTASTLYWDGTSFGNASRQWVSATSTDSFANWTFFLSGILSDGGNYLISARVTDNASAIATSSDVHFSVSNPVTSDSSNHNAHSSYTPPSQDVGAATSPQPAPPRGPVQAVVHALGKFFGSTHDHTPPIAKILTNIDHATKVPPDAPLTLQGTVSDENAIVAVTLAVTDITASSTETYSPTLSNGGHDWSITLPAEVLAPEHDYKVAVSARDSAGNVQNVSSYITFTTGAAGALAGLHAASSTVPQTSSGFAPIAAVVGIVAIGTTVLLFGNTAAVGNFFGGALRIVADAAWASAAWFALMGAAGQVRKRKIGVIPIDDSYAMVASALDAEAVERVYTTKGQAPSHPYDILISSIEELQLFDLSLTKDQKEVLVHTYWPGPVDVVLPCTEPRFAYLHRNTGMLTFRYPADFVTLSFLRKTGPVIAAPVNPQGEPRAQTITEAKAYFKKDVDFFVNRGKRKTFTETVIELDEAGEVTILKHGDVADRV